MSQMAFDDYEIDKLMTWARAHAPREDDTKSNTRIPRRVRLEISAEDQWIDKNGVRFLTPIDRIVVRAYLAEPRCKVNDLEHHYIAKEDRLCECGPLAEQRLG